MDGFVIDRADGRDDGEDWTENYEELPGGANISIILESTSRAGVGPRLHQHPYAETFLIRRGSATFTVGTEQMEGHAGQVLVVPANTPHEVQHRGERLRGGAHPRQPPVRDRVVGVNQPSGGR